MFWTDKKVLVIGGAGMIGRQLCTLLGENGATVRIMDNGCRAGAHHKPDKKGLDWAQWFPGNAQTWQNVYEASVGMDVVFNLAANVSGIVQNIQQPAKMLLDNLDIKMGVYRGMELNPKVECFVDISTACVYPHNAPVPTPEYSATSCIGPWNPEGTNFSYGIAKLVGEHLSHFLPQSRVLIARPSNTYGPYDYFGTHCHAIPALIKRIAGRENPLKLWGGGTQTRTFVYSVDMARAMMEFAERGKHQTVCNLGIPEEVTLFRTAELIAQALEIPDQQFEPDLSMPRGYSRRAPDLTIAKSLNLTCTKEWTPLEEGIQLTVDWWRDYYGRR